MVHGTRETGQQGGFGETDECPKKEDSICGELKPATDEDNLTLLLR